MISSEPAKAKRPAAAAHAPPCAAPVPRRYLLRSGLPAVVCCLFLWCAAAAGENRVLQRIGRGTVDWTEGEVTVVGVETPPEKGPQKSKNRQRALSAAKIDAHHQLLEILKAIRLDAFRTVGQYAAASQLVMAKLQEMTKGAEVIQQEYLSDGTVKVTLRMSIYGGFSQLVLPPDIRQIEPIKAVGAPPREERNQVDQDASAPEPTHSGLVVDAHGLGANPVMVLTVRDEGGQEVFGPAFASREFAVQWGMCRYVKGLEQAQKDEKTGSAPLIVKGLRAAGTRRTDLVISSSDASRIRGASQNLSFLRECRVTVVLDD
jgi:hypothetical protein